MSKSEIISLKLDKIIHEELQKLARENGVSLPSITREAIMLGLSIMTEEESKHRESIASLLTDVDFCNQDYHKEIGRLIERLGEKLL